MYSIPIARSAGRRPPRADAVSVGANPRIRDIDMYVLGLHAKMRLASKGSHRRVL